MLLMKKMDIKDMVVRYVDSVSGESREMNLRDVGEIAEQQGLDVVCVNENGKIPVVKVCDYNKLVFDKKKKEKENLKKQRSSVVDTKEIRISNTIAENDLKTKARNADKFLADGDKVMVSIKYKGRTIQFINNGQEQIGKLLKYITVPFTEGKYTVNGNQVSVLISKK